MPKKMFAFEQDGPQRLELTWGYLSYNNLTIRVDGQEIGKIENSKDLAKGRDFLLPDGSTLNVRLATGLTAELRVLRNGVPLPGSASDPYMRVREASYALYFIAGLNILVGIAAFIFPNSVLVQTMGGGLFSLIYGLIFLGLAIFTQRRSLVALVIGMVIYLLDSLLWVLAIFTSGLGVNPVTGLIMRVLIISLLFRGFSSIRELKKKEEAGQSVIVS